MPFAPVAALLVLTIGLAEPRHPAQAGSCGWLSAADLTALLGAGVTSKASGTGCTWSAASGGRKLIAMPNRMTGSMVEVAYNGARTSAAKGHPVADESGLGDKAFSARTAFGVAFTIVKGGRMVQFQYHVGGTGTEQDVAAARPLVKKALASF